MKIEEIALELTKLAMHLKINNNDDLRYAGDIYKFFIKTVAEAEFHYNDALAERGKIKNEN